MKTLKAQTDRIGYSFPGVSEDQMALLEAAKEKDEPVEKPMVTVDSISIDGKLKIISNQPMVYPADIQDFDYSKLLAIKMISA